MELDQDTLDAIHEAHTLSWDIDGFSVSNFAAELAKRGLCIAPTWQPIETAPKDGTKVLLAWGGRTVASRYLDNSQAKVMPWEGWVPPSGDPWPANKPTLWQPLPPPPPAEPAPPSTARGEAS